MSLGITLDNAGAVISSLGSRDNRDLRPLIEAFKASGLATPSYVHDQGAFHQNGRILREVEELTGARVLLAQKAFAFFRLYPSLRNYLSGTAASGLYEARLGAEEFGREVHVYSPAYKEAELTPLLEVADHLAFNSLSQWERYKEQVLSHPREVSAGLRINPEYSESTFDIYDPCGPGSRFGVTADKLAGVDLRGIRGFHLHNLCQKGADSLERTLEVVVEKFGHYLERMQWLNLGGGHLITSQGYDTDLLIGTLRTMRQFFPNLQIYLEPGEAVASRAGVLIGSVVDLIENGLQIAILDVSAVAHMPDIIEMPYRPHVEGADLPGVKPHTYRFGGPTCLSSDIIGDYSFDEPLQIGDQVVFHDQAHYTSVKNTLFNGVPLPSLSTYQENGEIEMIREFGYEDYRRRLG